MKPRSFIFLSMSLALVLSLQAQTPATPGAGRGGRGAAPAQAIPNLSLRPTGSSLGTIRVGAADKNIWFGWNVAIPAAAFHRLTLAEALAKSDTLVVTGVEALSTQRVSPEVPKPLDARLQTGERAAIVYLLRELKQDIYAYRIENLGADDAARRKVFEFAKSINVPLIVTGAAPPGVDKLADEFSINVAVESHGDPKALLASLPANKRVGIAGDLDGWMHAGIKPVDGLALVKDRLMAVNIRDINSAAVPPFFLAAYRDGMKGLLITVDAPASQDTYAAFQKSLTGFENAMLPAMAERVRDMVKSPAGQIRGRDKLSPEMQKAIDAGAPRKAIVTPKKPRKLLVTDLQMYSGHATIPHGNLMLELMGKYTGAFEPTFSNDLNLLKYPKIKEFDAVWLNNVCGMVHNDPEVREGILRFVREGGGIGGHHAVTFSDNNWPEFTEMMGGWAGAHHTEKQVIKVDDPNSPLTKSFGAASFDRTDEFYHFPMYSPYSREKQHILLSLDVPKSDMATSGHFCAECTRTDQDYGLAWIRTYGKGRTYFTPLGHTTDFYTDPMWTQHVLAAVQYILGDLDADATPSAKLVKK